MSALESSPVNLVTTVGLNPVCIDNEDVRERIIKAKQIDISSVPCVLIVYPSGGVEKYEGSGAFQWIEETVRKHMPPQPPPQPQPVQLPPQPSPIERKRYSRRHEIEESESSDEEYIERNRKPRKKSSKNKVKSKSSDEVSATAIEDLDDEEISENELPQRPPVAVRSGPNNYDITSEFGEESEPNRDMTSRTRSTTQPTTGNSNLMAAAMAMQKEREVGEPKNPRQIGDVTGERPV